MQDDISQKTLDEIFSEERANDFFDAFYGGAEEAAFTLSLVLREMEQDKAVFMFELKRREGHCLKCNLTYGLPEVLKKHKIINLPEIAANLAKRLGFAEYEWKLGRVEEVNNDLQIIPLTIIRL